MSEVFFTADTHFGHKAIIKYSERPFEHLGQMDEALIAGWNERVGSKDEVYHLGDVSFWAPARTQAILDALNGKIYLVRGNHDKRIRGALEDRFEWVKDYYEYRRDKQSAILCHYPFETWRKSHHGSWHLHGHSHGALTQRGRRLDVGVDTNDLRPYHWDEIVDFMSQQEFVPVDHHGRR